jgi:hypothetical protein
MRALYHQGKPTCRWPQERAERPSGVRLIDGQMESFAMSNPIAPVENPSADPRQMDGRMEAKVENNFREAAKGADHASDAKAFARRVAANQQILQAGIRPTYQFIVCGSRVVRLCRGAAPSRGSGRQRTAARKGRSRTCRQEVDEKALFAAMSYVKLKASLAKKPSRSRGSPTRPPKTVDI